MKSFKKYLKEASPTMSSGTNGFTASSDEPVAGYDPFFFPRDMDDLTQDYQTPAEPGLAKWRFSNIYPVLKLRLDSSQGDGPSIDQMVDASKEFVNREAQKTMDRIQRTFKQFQGITEEHKQCPQGKYYCHKEKKCMPIPRGYYVGARGWLKPDPDENGKKNGNGNGHSNGNGNGNGNGGNGNGGGVSESVELNIEVPKNETEFRMGLMFRETLDKNSGMLFTFEEVGEKSFHMKNTTIPLDIAFINKDGIIESIKELEPLNSNPISSDSEVLYALEVNRGWFEKNSIKIGDKII